MKKIVILLSLFLNFLLLAELGLNKPLSTNGKDNFDKIVNKKWSYDDTEIIIKKDKKGDYFSKNSSLDYDTGKIEEWNEKLTIYKEIYLKGDYYYYAYDTKLKKLVILDPKDLKIIY